MKQTILTVDDSATLRNVVRMMLVSQGFEVIEAGNVDEALQQLQVHKPDLMLLDLNMPGDDGMGLLRRMRALQLGRGLPVIVMTTSTSTEKRAEAAVLGAKAWITKPAPKDMLVKTVRTVLQMSARGNAAPAQS